MPKKTIGKSILVVEDDMAMRSIIVRKLKTNGYEITEADNGVDAVKFIMEKRPDLVLLDLMIPQIDGFTVLKTIREHKDPAIASTPVIVLSNLYSNEHIVKAQALKIQGYFVKAYLTTEEILKEINEVFEKKS